MGDKHFWARAYRLFDFAHTPFLGELSVCQRNEVIQAYFNQFLQRGSEFIVKDFLRSIQAIDDLDFVYSHEFRVIQN